MISVKTADSDLVVVGSTAGSLDTILGPVEVVGDTPGSGGPRDTGRCDNSRDIVHGFSDPRKAHVILDRGEAIAWALEQASEGDTVVVAGMGDRLHPITDAQELPRDDCDVVRQILSGDYKTTTPHRIAA